jgi:hypothetical protein
MPQLVILTGPIAAGKNTVADKLAHRLTGRGKTVVVADVDDVAAMVGSPGAAAAGLWFAAHEAHGALVGQWMRSDVDYVVVVGPIYSAEEQAAVTRTLPDEAEVLWIVIDAPVSVTLARAQADPGRGRSREPEFHHAAHRRFRELLPGIPADRVYDSEKWNPEETAVGLADKLTGPPPGEVSLQIHDLVRNDEAGADVIVRCHIGELRLGATVHLIDANHQVISGPLTVEAMWLHERIPIDLLDPIRVGKVRLAGPADRIVSAAWLVSA